MRKEGIDTLFDYSYWANRQILAAAAEVSVEQFTAPSSFTWRNLRGTLVHALDVERSWRGRLRSEPRESWNAALPENDYPTVTELADRWERDEIEMRAWLGSLDDGDVAGHVDLGGNDRFPLWCFLVHIVTHSAQQRRDAALLLTSVGHAPPEIEFLYYADWLRDRSGDIPRST